MKKTTIVVLPEHRAAYEAFRRERPQLSLTAFYSECVDFHIRHGDEASLRPALKAQHALIQKLDATLKILANPPPLVDHTRLEHHSKSLAEHVTAAVQHLEHGVHTAAVQAIDTYRHTFWRLALGAFTVGVMVGAGVFWLSSYRW
jgi:hypothetical protein